MSKVIKNFDASTDADGSRVFDMAEVGEEAREIIATAEEKAGRIIEEAKARAEKLKEQARAEGLEAGKAAVQGRLEEQIREEIRKARSRDVANLVKSLQTQILGVNEWRETLVRDAREQLIGLAVEIARRVIKREVTCSDEIARLNIEEAIRLSARRSRLLIRVSEMDMSTLETMLDEQPMSQDADSAIELIPSTEILPGGCLIESACGSVDARIETQLREIEKVLVGERGDG